MQWDIDIDGSAVLVLCLPEANTPVADVLRPQPYCIFPAAACAAAVGRPALSRHVSRQKAGGGLVITVQEFSTMRPAPAGRIVEPSRGLEPEVLAQAALFTIAGGAWSPAVAATGRTVGGGRGLSEGRVGNQRDQRESSDKCQHDTSPCLDHRPRFV